jgi:NAD(P)-dependent dehydrogenase (short-subunit alcohol dehydrogenase family)
MTLNGKRILITGAAKRVGRVIALAAAQAGADVIIHYGSSADEANALRDEITALGRSASLIQADLNQAKEVEGIIPTALEGGPIYALINNASIFTPLDWQAASLKDWNDHLNINLTAPFILSQSFAKNLPKGEHGRILNLLDWRATRPGGGAAHLPYTVSKAGLAALTEALAASLAPGISVNGLALGAVFPPEGETDLNRAIRSVPAARWAEPDELVQAALFLLTGPAYITGQILYLDGGRHLV